MKLLHFKHLFSENPLVKGSFLVLGSSVLSNFGAYLFHLFAGRLLGPSDYGILESLISIIYYLTIPTAVINLIVVKFVSREVKNKVKVVLFLKKFTRGISFIGILGLGLFLLLFPFLKQLVRVNSFALFLGVGIFGYLGIFLTICSASLQGTMQFAKLSLYNIFTPWIKLILAIVLILLGFRVGGAIYGMAIASLITVVLGYLFIRGNLPLASTGNLKIKESFKDIGAYSVAVFFSNLALTSFYTVDIILARFFLNPIAAGQYAAISVLGKIIFFASSPIASVMFPIISARQSEGKETHKILGLSFAMVLSISVLITLIFSLFPRLMISLLFGESYIGSSNSLGLFAVFISLYSLSAILINYFLSLSRTKVIILPVFMTLTQIALIAFFHQGIDQIVQMNILAMALLLFGLIICYFKEND